MIDENQGRKLMSILTYKEIKQYTLEKELKETKELIVHAYIHSNYKRCGYMQMTTQQKKLFDEIINSMNEDEDDDQEEDGPPEKICT